MSTSFETRGGVDKLVALKSAIKSESRHSLRKTAALQNAIFNSANFSSIATDAQGIIQIFNVGAERMLGYRAIDVVGHASLTDLSDPRELTTRSNFLRIELGAPIAPGFEALVFKSSQGIENIYELTYIRKDGSRLPAVVSVTVLRNEKEEVLGYMLIGTDNTASKQNEIDKEDVEAQFRSFFEQASVGMIICSERGQFLRVNQRFADLIGFTSEEIVGRLCAEATHPDDRKRESLSIAQLLDGEVNSGSWEKRFMRRDGSAVWCNLSVSMVKSHGQESLQFIGVVEDISLRKRAEKDLHHSQAMLRIAGTTAKLGGWMFEVGDQVLHCSEEACRIVEQAEGFSPTQFRTMEYFPTAYREAFKERVTRCGMDGIPFSFEQDLPNRDGLTIWVLIIGEAVRDPQGEIVTVQGAIQDITARKAVEASLLESQRRFREMADTFPFVVWTAEPDGRTDYANQSFSAYTQTEQGMSSNVQWAQFVHPEDLTLCRNAWSASIRTGQSYMEDYRLLEASTGSYHWHRVRAEPVRNHAGEIVKWYGTATDINATKLLEQRAIALANRLDSTLESITDGFFILDNEGRFDFVNHQAARMFDSSREALLGKNFRVAFPLLAGSAFDTKCLETTRDGMPGQLNEFQLLSPDQWYDASFFPSEAGLTVYFHDVTQSRANLSQLQLLRKAVSRLNDIVLITEAGALDENSPKIIFVNEAFERRTGYTQAEVLGKTPRFLQGPKTQRTELDRIRSALEKWQPVRAELINYTKAGEEFWLELDITPIADSKGWYTHWVAVERDISQRKLAEQEIRRLNGELEDRVQRRTQQLQAAYRELEAFSYSVSHDLRSPLTTIGGFSQLLVKSDRDQLSEKGTHYLKRICAATAYMDEVMSGLLSLSKISRSPLIRHEVNLSVIASRLVQELRHLEPRRDVRIDIQGDLRVSGDAAMAAIVMQNLIGNAWKYSSKNQQAHIEIGSETLEDGTSCIFVRDNGVGFDMAYAGKLFQAFQRLHKDTDFKGTGIGLANVNRVIDRHGGRIWADSAPNKGAVFRFTFGDG